jgi:glycosyltransferase involved in cell wall biosynthesis
MEVVARELIPELASIEPSLRLTAFVNREAAEAGDGPWCELIPAVTVPVNARNRLEWVRGEQQLLPRMAMRHGAHIVHSLASTAPGWGRFRRVVTVHDLIYRHYPDAHAGVLSLGMRALVRLATSRADRVIADSRNTRDDLVRLLRVPAERIDVVPLGVSAPDARRVAEPELRRAHRLGDRAIVLSVSAKRPHKNLIRLLDALAAIPAVERPVLVLPGYATWHEGELRERATELQIADDVRFLAWVSSDELEGLYAAASCVVFPSLYEGFGLPVLEAMRRGVPVACSNTSSLPEVAGDAALLFDPCDVRAIADSLLQLLRDRRLAAELVRRGREQAARFSWRRTAQETVASYRRALVPRG